MRELVRSSAQVRKRERESDLNAVGPKTVETSSTGQTGPAQTDRKNFMFSDLSCELN